MANLISRRKFAQFASMTISGTSLVETLLAEVQEKGGLSRETVKLLLEVNDLGDLQLSDDEIDKVKNSFERTLESLRKVRAYPVQQSLEPAMVFLVRR
jgi:hypothetical protein